MASKKKQEEARQDAPRDGRKDAPAKTTAKSVGDTASEVTVAEQKSKTKSKTAKADTAAEAVAAPEKTEAAAKKAETAVKNKTETVTAKAETAGQDATEERKHREPQMVTVNGQKVTHGHAYQSTVNPDTWFFTAKLDGTPLRPMPMTPEDTAAYKNREISVEQLMQNYYPTKLLPKVSKEEYDAGNVLSDGRTVDKMNVYKEHDETKNDFGRYKLYAVVGDQRMSTVMTTHDLNAFFDRTVTPAQLVERNFGERLHLASAYQQYRLPEDLQVKEIRIAKEKNSNVWNISVNLGELGKTSKKPLAFDDGYSYFTARTATREQLAAKYLLPEIKQLMAAPRQEKAMAVKL